ncbi:MAG: response regulator [bacterium]|nr:response regulator [Candidatus Margulisiibacteriota bacterium]
MAKKILVVEDEKIMSEIIAARLGSRGYDVLVAADGQKGLVLAKKERPDLVVLDLLMPNMDGYEVVKQLKEDENTKEIPVVIYSVKEEDTDMEKAFELGADAYCLKDFDSKVLLKKITQILGEE